MPSVGVERGESFWAMVGAKRRVRKASMVRKMLSMLADSEDVLMGGRLLLFSCGAAQRGGGRHTGDVATAGSAQFTPEDWSRSEALLAERFSSWLASFEVFGELLLVSAESEFVVLLGLSAWT